MHSHYHSVFLIVSELEIPENANVFYAVNRSDEAMHFILRRKTDQVLRCTCDVLPCELHADFTRVPGKFITSSLIRYHVQYCTLLMISPNEKEIVKNRFSQLADFVVLHMCVMR